MPEQYALIVGSGLVSLCGSDDGQIIDTRFGAPSAAVKNAEIGGQNVLTLARHGEPHRIPPHAINYCANLVALKKAGATHIISMNTVGVITNIRDSGQIAIPDQIMDYTWGRQHTVYDAIDDHLDHIEFTDPFTSSLRRDLLSAAVTANLDCYDGGVYATTQGPRLESAAEVDRFERDGADFLGMTAMPEASIARELGMAFVCLTLIVNRAAGRSSTPIHADVEASTLSARTQAISLLQQFFKDISER